MSSTTTTTVTAPKEIQSFTIKPTPTWTPLPIQGEIPSAYRTPKHNLEVIPLHPTFGCELRGLDWTKPISPDVYTEIREVVNKYGAVVCRNTSLTDEAHIEFSSYFGELDDVRPYQKAGRTHRLKYPELFDAGNIDPATGKAAPLSAAQVIGNKANEQFHVDSSFNARRAGHSLLLAHKLPPSGTGGATEFADSRTAYEDLSEGTKAKLEGKIAGHSLFHSRKKAVPEYFFDMDPSKKEISRHELVQKHEWSERMNLYIASYTHHIEGMPAEESTALIEELLAHVSKPKYRLTIDWEQEGDMIIWDNTSVMHRATGGSYEGVYPRDMRRTTVKDMSSKKYGLNGEGSDWRVGLP
ncbi:Taurine catabolism dioxygenase TauD-like protein 2 [Elsinoe fawcettii]|nr:Taurine catabolism dioxygenase TauD-like protein 2 [Elsinoe fawcettii]